MANSRHVAKRIATWWGRHAKVVPPPVDVEWFRPDPGTTREDFFLLAGRLVPYKRPDIAIEAANRLGVRLVVAGDGRMFAGLERIAGPSVELMGSVDAETLRDLFRRCRALVFPGEEDFGIVPVEAQACGAPVIAARVGGILDSVLEGTTGQLYQSERGAEVASLTKALEQFDDGSFDPAKIRSHAMSFAPDHFASAFRLALTEILGP